MTKQFPEVQEFYLKQIQCFLINFIDSIYQPPYDELRDIFYYHIGLDDELDKQGKRIRPLLMLICAEGVGVPFKKALPAAIAIELIHNFSLIHDDIEDDGEIRRGKLSVWKKWGLAQGLNAGDAMFNAAFLTLSNVSLDFSSDVYRDAYILLSETCSELTKGQFLDISFETQDEISVENYIQMITGKTAALLACSMEMGALLGGLDQNQRKIYHDFGKNLGIAFQIYDDWLGIWGDEKELGKSTVGDLLEKKKTYPIILGLKASEKFRNKFINEKMSYALAVELSNELKNSGIENEVKEICKTWTKSALVLLNDIACKAEQKQYLKIITENLLMRSR